jgi:hypothetical protein
VEKVGSLEKVAHGHIFDYSAEGQEGRRETHAAPEFRESQFAGLDRLIISA